MKISIFSFVVNDLFPIDIVNRAFKKFMKDDYEFILFNDAYEPQMEKNLTLIASHNNIKHVRVPQEIHRVQNPSECYASTVNWAVHNYAVANKCEIIVLIHSDILPICHISIEEILGNNIVASTCEFRKMGDEGFVYLYPAFTIISMTKLTNPKELDFGLTPGFDVGGKTKEFLKKYPNGVKLLPNYQALYFLNTLLENDPMREYWKTDLEISRKAGISSGWICEGLYHYMCGSAWNIKDNPLFAQAHKDRMDLFLKYFY